MSANHKEETDRAANRLLVFSVVIIVVTILMSIFAPHQEKEPVVPEIQAGDKIVEVEENEKMEGLLHIKIERQGQTIEKNLVVYKPE